MGFLSVKADFHIHPGHQAGVPALGISTLRSQSPGLLVDGPEVPRHLAFVMSARVASDCRYFARASPVRRSSAALCGTLTNTRIGSLRATR